MRDILTDERYAGTMIYNRTTQKLKTPSRRNPKDQWIRTPEAFEPVIDPRVFADAAVSPNVPASTRRSTCWTNWTRYLIARRCPVVIGPFCGGHAVTLNVL